MTRITSVLAFLCLLAFLPAAQAQKKDQEKDLAVEVTNASEPTLCAEKDNVFLKLASPIVRSFSIEAVQPAYIGLIKFDHTQPDFMHCENDISDRKDFSFTPRRQVLFEDRDWRILSITFGKFWRQSSAVFTLDTISRSKTYENLHLVQIWKRSGKGFEEVAVLYPGDGYWRLRPLPRKPLDESVYGSSFLIGPVEMKGRPIVDIKAVTYRPQTRVFTLLYQNGELAFITLRTVDSTRVVLDVVFPETETKHAPEMPFAALRSMYVTDTNADAAEVQWREQNALQWQQSGVMQFGKAMAVELRALRKIPSLHNTSAPDTVFRDFRAP